MADSSIIKARLNGVPFREDYIAVEIEQVSTDEIHWESFRETENAIKRVNYINSLQTDSWDLVGDYKLDSLDD